MVDLKKRLITGLILATLVISGIIFLPQPIFLDLSAALILFASWEWTLLMGLPQNYRWVYVVILGLLMIVAQHAHIPLIVILWSSLLWWFIASLLIMTYPKTAFIWFQKYEVTGLMGAFVLIPCWLSLNAIRQLDQGITILFFLLFIVWGADIGAYWIGQLPWKKRHYLPEVSPKKTYEGLIGGVLFSLLVGILFVFFFTKNHSMQFWMLQGSLILITALFSVVGDLFKSMFKRKLGIKDVGNYLPGHGGLLDRIDSLTSAAPIFLLGLLLLHHYYAVVL